MEYKLISIPSSYWFMYEYACIADLALNVSNNLLKKLLINGGLNYEQIYSIRIEFTITVQIFGQKVKF